MTDRTSDAWAAGGNRVFAFEPREQGGDPHVFVNPFTNTQRVTVAPGGPDRVGIEVVAGPGAHVNAFYDASTGRCAYFWGLAGHPDVPRQSLLPWMMEAVLSGNAQTIRDVVGMFIVLIDDRRAGAVYMVSDHLGLRPWFVGRHGERGVAGSDMWSIHEAGLTDGRVNYDAVASWLYYTFDCTGQSLFSGYRQLGSSSVGSWKDGCYAETPYVSHSGAENKPSRDEIVEQLHGRISRAFAAMTEGLDRVVVALSGGFDSRLLAGLASQTEGLKVEAVCLDDQEAEGASAARVAEALHIPLQLVATDGSLWNVYDEPYHFMAGGFPITKQQSHLAAVHRPGVACLNGFIGDPIVRGTIDRVDGKLERETTEDLAVAFERIHRINHTTSRFDLLPSNIVGRWGERLVPYWRREINRWTHTAHPFLAANIFVRQRQRLSNNFLQHLHISEALVPFAAWDVLEYRFQNDASCYTWETYEALFEHFYPKLAHIPHNLKMGARTNVRPTRSRATRPWSAAVLAALSRSRLLSIVSRRKAIPRLIGAGLGMQSLDVVALFLYRMLLLDQRLSRSGVDLDWRQV